jgi:integrase
MPTIKVTAEWIKIIQNPTTPQEYYWDDELTGFGLVVGRTGEKTFVARGRVDGKRHKVTIGRLGAPRPDGHPWTAKLARNEAKRILGKLSAGIEPAPVRRHDAPQPTGPTHADAVKAHNDHMKKKGRSERTIKSFNADLNRHMSDWMDEPLSELTSEVLSARHELIKEKSKARSGTNPLNEKGSPAANRIMAHVSAAWNSLNKKLSGKLGSWNPAKSVDRDLLKPKRERLADVADWYTRVMTVKSGIRRDALVFALFTALRHEDVRFARWEHVDLDKKTLLLPDPKGGPTHAFTIPLSPTAVRMLERRKKQNIHDLGQLDGGWVFPTILMDGTVGPMIDIREQRRVGDGHVRCPAEDIHTLRREFESIAQEEGVSDLDQHVLTNHAFGGRNVNETYIRQSMDHLAMVTAKIDAGINRRIEAAAAKRDRILRIA